MTLSYATTDAGRASAGFAERLDCAVRSLALSTGMSYAEAHSICADAGRRPRRIMRPSAVHLVYATHALAPWVSFLDSQPSMRPTVAQLVRRRQWRVLGCLSEGRAAPAGRGLLGNEACIRAYCTL